MRSMREEGRRLAVLGHRHWGNANAETKSCAGGKPGNVLISRHACT